MSTARQGRDREHRAAADLTKHGWRTIMRSAASKGSADLAMVHAVHGLALIQVGGRRKTLGPAERARLLADAHDAGALALLASARPGVGFTYWIVDYAPPSRWQQFHPGEADELEAAIARHPAGRNR